MNRTNKTSRRKLVLDVTKEDYDKEAGAGIEEEFRLKPGRHQFRPARVFATRDELSVRNTKVRITINLDLDVLNHFKQQASAPNAAPYQTQINNALRQFIEQTSQPDYSRLIEDEAFIKKLEDRLDKRLSARLTRARSARSTRM